MSAADRHDRAWGDRPFTSITLVHAMFWYMAVLLTVAAPGSLPWLLTFEALGLLFYSRWLLGLEPYTEGASPGTQRCST
jgi:hypothetical protein